MDIGILVLRVVVGLLFVGHGTQKLFGWVGGHGLAGTAGFFESVGLRPGRRQAMVAGLAETVGGGLLTLGLFTPLGAAILIGVMVTAISTVHWEHGLWNVNGGYEYPLVNAAAAAVVAFTGPGDVSLDAAFDLGWSGNDWGIAAVAAGLLAASIVLANRHVEQPPELVRGDADVAAPTREEVGSR